MPQISRVVLFEKLNTILFTTLESATSFCKLRENPYVELAHWLQQLMQQQDSDIHHIIQFFSLDRGLLDTDIIGSLDSLPRGASSVSDISEHIDYAVERAWGYTSLNFNSNRIRGGHLFIALLKTHNLVNILRAISSEFMKINADILLDEFDAILINSKESLPVTPSVAGVSANSQDMPALQKYAQNLTALAHSGSVDPVHGRDEEIRLLVDILQRRRQNNPLLVGDAGVGKTAVVEGLAMRIASGDVPLSLCNVQLWLLDIGLLQAGAGMKGEFEARLQALISDVQSSPQPVVLFIDEIHTLVGAGGQQGTGDAANMLKPMLARGQLRTIGATTWSEYKKYIEKDPALTRRFQTIQIKEPSEEDAIVMLRSIIQTLETHHRVQILDEAVISAVKLSHRYIPARQLPDKAVALLDTACARVIISQETSPGALENCLHRFAALKEEIRITEREVKAGLKDCTHLTRLAELLTAAESEKDALVVRYEKEKELVKSVRELHVSLLAADENQANSLRNSLNEKRQALNALQNGKPMSFAIVDADIIASIVSNWTGIPLGQMVQNDIGSVLHLADTLKKRVIGQDHSLEAIASRVCTSRARLDDPNKPVGVFMLCGPSGTGKTETALSLAESLYGGEQNLITINMSEFQEAHTVSSLKGAPPGYVGYGEGGVLTEAVRRRPYSVVLLDEIEKAHSDVHELFFQVFDKGWMEDGEGRHIDFRNTIIILTSNVGADVINDLFIESSVKPGVDKINGMLHQLLLNTFPAAFIGRLSVIPYYPLNNITLTEIIKLQFKRIENRLFENHGIKLMLDDGVIEQVIQRCTYVDSGGRMVDAVLTNAILPKMSQLLLARNYCESDDQCLYISVDSNDFVFRLDY